MSFSGILDRWLSLGWDSGQCGGLASQVPAGFI
jgi:hypothetical protein